MVWDKLEASVDPIFDAVECANLEADPALKVYRCIGKAHVLGLLAALGEHAIRAGSNWTPDRDMTSASILAYRQVVRFYHEPHVTSDSPSPPWFLTLSVKHLSPPQQALFEPSERAAIALMKYVRGHEGVTRRQLVGLLFALSRYARTAPMLPLAPSRLEGVSRQRYAHNALVFFAERPFTLRDFRMSLEAMPASEESLLAGRMIVRPQPA
jgi:hypothetical protein